MRGGMPCAGKGAGAGRGAVPASGPQTPAPSPWVPQGSVLTGRKQNEHFGFCQLRFMWSRPTSSACFSPNSQFGRCHPHHGLGAGCCRLGLPSGAPGGAHPWLWALLAQRTAPLMTARAPAGREAPTVPMRTPSPVVLWSHRGYRREDARAG